MDGKKKKNGWSKPVIKGPKRKPGSSPTREQVMSRAEAQRRGMAATRKKAQDERARRKKVVADRDRQRLLDDMYNSPQGRASRERMRRGF